MFDAGESALLRDLTYAQVATLGESNMLFGFGRRTPQAVKLYGVRASRAIVYAIGHE